MSRIAVNHCFLSALLIFLLSSCAGNLYPPSVAYAPQLREKNDAEAAISAGFGSGCQVQAAWAPSSHFQLQAQTNTIGRFTGNLLGGIGYRLAFPLKNQQKEIWFLHTSSAGYSGGKNDRTLYRYRNKRHRRAAGLSHLR